MKLFNTITAMLDLKAAEIRIGITLVEAVALDERLAALSKVGDPAKLLEIAVIAGQLGLAVDDIEPMARSWYLAQPRFRKLAEQAEKFAAEFGPRKEHYEH